MAVLEMLAEVVRSEELLRVVALAELVHGRKVLESAVPIWARVIGEFFTTVTTRVVRGAGVGLAGWRGGAVEGGLEAWEGGTGPGVATEM
jgi:hypothetical protein